MTVTRLPICAPNETTPPAGTIGAIKLCHLADISYRQLDFWTRAGHIHCLPRPTNAGSGWPRHYTCDEASALVLMAALVRDGLNPRPAAEHARRLLTDGATTIAGIRLHLPEDA